MATWWDSVAVVVEFSPTTDPLDTPVWVDITDYVSVDGWETFRGRENEQDDVGVASMSLTLLNHDRRFDPDHTSGPYYNGGAGLLPMRRIRVRTAGVTVFSGHVLGWPQTFVHNDNVVRVEAVDGTRFNRNTPLAVSAYRIEMEADSPDAYWPLQQDLDPVTDSTPSITVFDGANTDVKFVARSRPLDDSNMMGLDAAVLHDIGNVSQIVSGGARCFEFWLDIGDFTDVGATPPRTIYVAVEDPDGNNRFYIQIEPANDSAVAFSWHQADDTRGILNNDFGLGLQPGPNHIAVRTDSTDLDVIVNGVTVANAALISWSSPFAGNGLDIGLIEDIYMSHLAIYETAPTVARLKAHYQIGISSWGRPYNERTGERIDRVLDEVGWASADRDIATGETVVGPYRPGEQFALDVAQQCVTAEQGRLFHAGDGKLTFFGRQELWARTSAATFTDDATNTTDVKYLSPLQAVGSDIEQISNTVTASWSNVNQAGTVIGGGITRKDTASATAYGPSALTLDTPVLDTAANASALASWVLDQRADPATELRHLTVEMRADVSVNVSTILGLELADLVTIERTLVETGADLEWTAEVAGIGHRMQGASWIVDLFLVRTIETATAVPLLEVGSDATYSTIGSTNKIGL